MKRASLKRDLAQDSRMSRHLKATIVMQNVQTERFQTHLADSTIKARNKQRFQSRTETKEPQKLQKQKRSE